MLIPFLGLFFGKQLDSFNGPSGQIWKDGFNNDFIS